METALYNEKHTKTILESERLVINKKVMDLKSDNGQKSREISRNKMFNKKDEENKQKREQHSKLQTTIDEMNKQIEKDDVDLDKERRMLEDKNLLKRKQETVLGLKQENNKADIDISIAKSRIVDLTNLKSMTLAQIRELITEKRKTEKENQEIEAKNQGKGLTDQEMKAKTIDAEKEQIISLKHKILVQKETATHLMEKLKDEETKAKDMLDAKIKEQNNLTVMNEDLVMAKDLAKKHREEIIKLQIKQSQLVTLDDKLKGELKTLTEENEFYKKKNAEFEIENAKLNKEIQSTIQKIDINYLLKEIDGEDLRLVAQNNKMMTNALHNLLSKWENIQKLEAEAAK